MLQSLPASSITFQEVLRTVNHSYLLPALHAITISMNGWYNNCSASNICDILIFVYLGKDAASRGFTAFPCISSTTHALDVLLPSAQQPARLTSITAFHSRRDWPIPLNLIISDEVDEAMPCCLLLIPWICYHWLYEVLAKRWGLAYKWIFFLLPHIDVLSRISARRECVLWSTNNNSEIVKNADYLPLTNIFFVKFLSVVCDNQKS